MSMTRMIYLEIEKTMLCWLFVRNGIKKKCAVSSKLLEFLTYHYVFLDSSCILQKTMVINSKNG